MPARSNDHPRLCVELGLPGSGRVLVAAHRATAVEKPARSSCAVTSAREARGSGMARRCWMRSAGRSRPSASPDLTSPGSESSTHTCTLRGRRCPNCDTMLMTTLPPNEWPTSTCGNSFRSLSTVRMSTAAVATVCGPGGCLDRLADSPWQRRSTSSTCHEGKPSTSMRAKLCMLRLLPRMPCTRTQVGGVGPPGARVVQRARAPCTSSYDTRGSVSCRSQLDKTCVPALTAAR
mmetsp:Transcript_38096/g.96307  ORF Transcript_38096/g.96307 Transcript_38096/m.96307 type:complete len:234 (+) Transcript_38096:1186-1887(+)